MAPRAAQAQHPTPVTSIVNSDQDTTLEVNHNGSLLMPGTTVTSPADSIPAEGAGTRLMWYPARAALRAGRVGQNKDGTQWNASKVGRSSVAFGLDTKASSKASVAMGKGAVASGNISIAMGKNTTASSFRAVAMGKNTTASKDEAFAMGEGPTASGFRAVAMGKNTTATSSEAVAMGNSTIASASEAFAMGREATASAKRSAAFGRKTTAATETSLSIGECNEDNQTSDGTLFVVGNGNSGGGANCDSNSDVLVLDQSGTLSISGAFQAGPTNSTFAGEFEGDKNAADGDTTSHVAMVDNTNTGSDADGLAIQAGPKSSSPGGGNNFITFFRGDGTAVGGIEGNGSGGITQTSGGADFAEELPVAEGASVPEPTDVVGVRGGEVSLTTKGADRVMIASRAPAVTGNTTPATEADDARRVAVAFIGQVPARVRGKVHVGDLIVASGEADGTARRVSPEKYRRAEHGPIVGQAWSAKSTPEIGEVTVAVGLGQGDVVAQRLENQRNQIEELRAENEAIKNQQKKLKERLATLEAQRTSSLPAGLTASWGLVLLLGIGGLLGGALIWRRRE